MSKFLECIGVGKIYPGKTEPVEAPQEKSMPRSASTGSVLPG